MIVIRIITTKCKLHPTLAFKNTHVSYHVSKLLNFLVTTFPKSMPNRSTILWARSGCDVPLKTLIFGILLRRNELGFSKFARIKLFARTGSDTTGITAITSHTTNQITAEKDLHHIRLNVFYWGTVMFSWWESHTCWIKILKTAAWCIPAWWFRDRWNNMNKITDHLRISFSSLFGIINYYKRSIWIGKEYPVIRGSVSAKQAQSNVENCNSCDVRLMLRKYKSGSIEAMR
jgi:hypothetical protein